MKICRIHRQTRALTTKMNVTSLLERQHSLNFSEKPLSIKQQKKIKKSHHQIVA